MEQRVRATLSETAAFANTIWQAEFTIDWSPSYLIGSIVLYVVLSFLTALWSVMIYCHMRAGRRTRKSLPTLCLFAIAFVGCIARIVWASIRLQDEYNFWAAEIPKRIGQISVAWSLTLVVAWYSVVAQSVRKAIVGSESRRRALFWTCLRVGLLVLSVAQLGVNIAVPILRNNDSAAFDIVLMVQVLLNVTVILIFTIAGVHIWLLTRRQKFIFKILVKLLLVQLAISVVYMITALAATAVWLASQFEMTRGIAIVVVVSETAMLFSMLFIVARVGHASWREFFSPLLSLFNSDMRFLKRGRLSVRSELEEDESLESGDSAYAEQWGGAPISDQEKMTHKGLAKADVMAAMFHEQPSLFKVLTKPRYKVVKDAFTAYCEQQFCDENIRFWSEAQSFLNAFAESEKGMRQAEEYEPPGNESAVSINASPPGWQERCLEAGGKLINDFVSSDAPSEVNIDSRTRARMLDAYGAKDAAALVDGVAAAQQKVLVLMAQDSYARFLTQQDAIYSGITDIHR